MKKILLSLLALFSLNIKAETPEIITPEKTEESSHELRVSDVQTQVPVLVGYFINSFGSGLGSGIGAGLARSAFTEIDAPYDMFLYTTVLSKALLSACDKEQEAVRCAAIADRYNENIMQKCREFADQQMGDGNEAIKTWFTYGLYQQMDKFQPEQFEVKNRAYSVAATILGFAAGAYVGSKIGAGMYNGFGWLWNKCYPAVNDTYIALADTIPKQ